MLNNIIFSSKVCEIFFSARPIYLQSLTSELFLVKVIEREEWLKINKKLSDRKNVFTCFSTSSDSFLSVFTWIYNVYLQCPWTLWISRSNTTSKRLPSIIGQKVISFMCIWANCLINDHFLLLQDFIPEEKISHQTFLTVGVNFPFEELFIWLKDLTN